MAAGTGSCCCGDTATPASSGLSSSSGRPIAPLTQDCRRCKSPCNSPDKNMPAFIYIETSLLNGGQYCRNITAGSFEVFDCDCDFRISGIWSLWDNGSFRLDAVNNSCLYVSDWYLSSNCENFNSSTLCSTSGCGFTNIIGNSTSRPNAVSTENWFFMSLNFASSGCGNPEFAMGFRPSMSDGSAGPKPTTKQEGPSRANIVTNETFNCDPFFYQGDFWFFNVPSVCCVATYKPIPGILPPACAACCRTGFGPGGGWYNGVRITMS